VLVRIFACGVLHVRNHGRSGGYLGMARGCCLAFLRAGRKLVFT